VAKRRAEDIRQKVVLSVVSVVERIEIRIQYVLLNEANVALVSGSAFGADEYLRLSYATSIENISKGLQPIEGVTNKFKRGLHE
jgi:aspartate/methionine/tyrosine aminotransferase